MLFSVRPLEANENVLVINPRHSRCLRTFDVLRDAPHDFASLRSLSQKRRTGKNQSQPRQNHYLSDFFPAWSSLISGIPRLPPSFPISLVFIRPEMKTTDTSFASAEIIANPPN